MKKTELLKQAKPILFNEEMVIAILDGKKTVTRRIIKLPNYGYFMNEPPRVKPRYNTGDILYVRETWCEHPKQTGKYCYRATGVCGGESTELNCQKPYDYTENCDLCEWLDGCIKWRPSIHMPKEAARLFLRVTDLRIERLHDITAEQCVAEGLKKEAQEVGTDFVRGMFSDLWDSTIKKADLNRYGWQANPWVWVIEFERIK